MKTFNARVKRFAGKAGLYIEIPFDCEEAFGSKGKIKVKATINGQPVKTVLIPTHNGKHLISITRGLRVKINIHSDEDELIIILKKDETAVHHPVPHDLELALKKDNHASAFFHSLSATHRRQFIKWLEEAKREDTRTSRLDAVMEKLVNKERMK